MSNMKWMDQLLLLFENEEWSSAVELLQSVLEKYPDESEGYIQIIYLLHHILLESEYPGYAKDHDLYAVLLKKYFDEAEGKFPDNAEYLFFIGRILYIAEWYFGIDDDFKPMAKRKAFKMQKRASDLCPDNDLYKWAWMFSMGDKNAVNLGQQILEDSEILKWLKTKGIAGKYILDALKNQILIMLDNVG